MNRISNKLLLVAFLITAILSGCAPGGVDQEADNTTLESQFNDAPGGAPSNDALDVTLAEIDKATTQSTFKLSSKYSHLDPKKVIPKYAFEKAMDFFQKYESKFKNKNYITIIDFKAKSTTKRMYVVNMKTGAVERYLTAHGSGSDTNHDGYATSFSNVSGSGKSSLGAYMVAETYSGKYGLSVRLDGLQSTNSNARSRAVVMHPASYVSSNRSLLGRSLGCPAIEFQYRNYLIGILKGGSMLYAAYQ